MSNETKSIHEFDIQLICNYYYEFKRQGPGSPEITRKALSFIDNLSAKSKIADIGCGTGGQTLELAKNTDGQITGVDFFPRFIELFNQQMQEHQLNNRVKGIVGDMKDLSFSEGELDLIWSEGAIYNIGFERGLNEWRKYLKTGGYIAVSEASWFTEKRPKEIEDFWMDAYPEIDTLPVKLNKMQQAGYMPVASFILPEDTWIEHFFAPQIAIQEAYLKKHADNTMIVEFIRNQQHERSLYMKYKDYYGYAFYIGKKI